MVLQCYDFKERPFPKRLWRVVSKLRHFPFAKETGRQERDMGKKIGSGLLMGIAFLFFVLHAVSSSSPESSHPRIVIRDFEGMPLQIDSQRPYSPKQTCGPCHPYEKITQGYHFQQGRTDATGRILISDSYDSQRPWNLSAGMFGKYRAATWDGSMLAHKVSRSPSEIDKSTFSFLRFCGVCHPGGGFGEFDRGGNLYYQEKTKTLGWKLGVDNPVLDGDYTPFSMGVADNDSSWERSGLSEADCLMCHLKGYRWKERGAVVRGGFFKYGPSAGAGWATVKIIPGELDLPRAEEMTIQYGSRDVGDFENLHLQILRRPPDENCLNCHGALEGRVGGSQWSPRIDIHGTRGMDCVSCHPSDGAHNFAKGDVLDQTVRDDLDHTMYSCEDCHYKGKHKRAPRYRHPFSPRHMKRIACQTCHIPFLTVASDVACDHASSGITVVYKTERFLSNDPREPKKWVAGVDPHIWYPSVREFKGRIIPSKPVAVLSWGDFDEKTKVVRPIPLWKIRNLKRPNLKDDDGDGVPELNSNEEIFAFLTALKGGKDPFGNPIAPNPALLKGGFLYHLTKKGEIEKIEHEQADLVEYSINHGIMGGPDVLGARGCKDCHVKNSPFFLRKILIDPYDEKGKPVYVEAWQRLGIPKERLDRLLMEQ